MRLREFTILNEREINHSPYKVDARFLMSLLDNLKKIDNDEIVKFDRFFRSDDPIMLLGFLGDPRINKYIPKSVHRDTRPKAQDTAPAVNKVDDPAIPPDQVSGFFYPPSYELFFQDQGVQQLMGGGTGMIDAGTTIAHESMHRGLTMVYDVPFLRKLVHPDLNSVWNGGWGRIDSEKYPEIKGAQVTPEHCMIYSTISPMSSPMWQKVALPLLFTPRGIKFFTGKEYSNKQIAPDVDSDIISDEDTFRKFYEYWKYLYHYSSQRVGGYLQNHIRSIRPRARPEQNQ